MTALKMSMRATQTSTGTAILMSLERPENSSSTGSPSARASEEWSNCVEAISLMVEEGVVLGVVVVTASGSVAAV